MADPQAMMMQMPPGVDPVDYANAIRQQQIAQALQSEALSPINLQQPASGVGGKFVQARVSPLSGIAKLAEAMMAKKSMDKSTGTMAQIYARGLQAFGGGPAAAPAAAPGTPQPGYQGGAGASDAGQPGSTQPQQLNPMNPMGAPAQPLLRLYMQDPAKYLEAIQGTPEWKTALLSTGGDVGMARHMLLAKARKDATIDMRQGSEAIIPGIGGQPGQVIRAPNLGQDEDLIRDAQGNPIGTRLLPGATSAEAARGQAQEIGKVTGQVNEFDTGGGGKRYSLGLPPDLAGVGAVRNYFGPGTNAGSNGGAPGLHGAPPISGPAVPPNTNGAAPAAAPPGITPGIWRAAPQRPASNALGEDPYLKGTVDKMVGKNEELSDKYGSESDLADQRIAFNNEALKVLNGSSTGPLSERLNAIGAHAAQLGIKLPWIPDQSTVNNSAELKKFLLRNPLLSLKPTFGGRPAASEFQILANDASPSPQMLQGAISRLVQLDNQAAGYSKQRAMDYSYFHDHANGNPQRFESWYSSKVPFAKWLDENPNGRAGESHIDTSTPQASVTHNGVTYEKRNGQWVAK